MINRSRLQGSLVALAVALGSGLLVGCGSTSDTGGSRGDLSNRGEGRGDLSNRGGNRGDLSNRGGNRGDNSNRGR